MLKNEKQLSAIVHQYYREKGIYTNEVNRLVNAAGYDLYFGPTPEGDEPDGDGWEYPGFVSACDAIRDALDDVREIWVDLDCDCVMEREPEGEEVDGEWIEPYTEETYHLERKEVLKYLTGKELASYL